MRYSASMFGIASTTSLVETMFVDIGTVLALVLTGVLTTLISLLMLGYGIRKVGHHITGGDSSEWTKIYKDGVYTHYSGRKRGNRYQTRLDKSYTS